MSTTLYCSNCNIIVMEVINETDRSSIRTAGRDLPPGFRVPVCRWDHENNPGWDREEKMTRTNKAVTVLYTYNMRRRPLDFGTAPDGWVDYLPDKSRWGWIVYSRQLTDDEIYEYELEPVSSNSEEK